MPQRQASIKDRRQIKKRTARNLLKKRQMSYLVKQATKDIDSQDKVKAVSAFQKLQKSLDKAAKTGWLKKNTAARKKSRLMKKINSLK